MPSETPAPDLCADLRSALLSTDLAKLEALWQTILNSPPTEKRRAAAILAKHGLSDRAAQLHEQLGDLPSAQALYQQAGLLTDAGRVSEQLGDKRLAEALYRQSIVEHRADTAAQSPDEAVADRSSPALRLGQLLLRQGRAEEAIPFLQAIRRKLLTNNTPLPLLDEVEPALLHALVQVQLPEAALSLLQSYSRRHPDAPPTVAEWLLTAPQPSVQERMLLGRYRLQRLIGAGAMGRVFVAEDTASSRSVAIKLLPMPIDSQARDSKWQMFCREAQILQTLRHPNIVAVHDFSESAGVLVMELLRGGSLGEQPLPLSLVKTKRVLRDVCAGLSAAHAASVLHRDIKPHNLFLDEAHNTKIGDFGAALLAQLGATQTESLVGTLAYMSPEQLEGQKLTVASDLYSLGVTLFQLLTGRLPFVGPDWVSQHLRQPPPDPRSLRPALPAAWADLCLQLLAKSEADRPSTMDELAQRITQLPDAETAQQAGTLEGKLPSADDGLLPHLETHSLHPIDGTSPTLLYQTGHSAVYHVVSAKLARGVLIERFDREKLMTPTGQHHLHWLRAMARLGGPGLQRVLRIMLDGHSPEVHFEETVGIPLGANGPPSRQDEAILLATLHAIHAEDEVHGNISDAVIVEKYGAQLQVVGRGPLGWKSPAPTPKDEERTLLAMLRSRKT